MKGAEARGKKQEARNKKQETRSKRLNHCALLQLRQERHMGRVNQEEIRRQRSEVKKERTRGVGAGDSGLE